MFKSLNSSITNSITSSKLFFVFVTDVPQSSFLINSINCWEFDFASSASTLYSVESNSTKIFGGTLPSTVTYNNLGVLSYFNELINSEIPSCLSSHSDAVKLHELSTINATSIPDSKWAKSHSSSVGDIVGLYVGSVVGSIVGSSVGSDVGSDVGSIVGSVVGSDDGSVVGSFVGSSVGEDVGSGRILCWKKHMTSSLQLSGSASLVELW